MAAVGPDISKDLGSPSGYVWYVSAWIISITISFTIVGANADLLGRRWFLVAGNAICFVGHIIVGTAKTSNAVTAGLAITGFGAANCQLAAFALGELLPNKWRHIGETNTLMFLRACKLTGSQVLCLPTPDYTW
jgi:MFS family permease